MIKFILGIIVGAAVLLLVEFLWVTRGGLSMATAASPLPGERYLANHAIATSIGRAAQDQSPVSPDEANLIAGAKVYQQYGCMGCHGSYGQGPSDMSKRMYPHIPPLLPPSEGVTDDPVGVTRWVVRNGIRFSGMPAFNGMLNETQQWQVSQLLAHANQLSPAVRKELGGKSE
ncbi:MAG TPA: cytochrome c [Chthoniobacterales bacterium]|jgi:mono/diheme cytochrome c family protein